MKNLILFSGLFLMIFSGCKKDPQSTGRVYFPDMYYSKAMEPYAETSLFPDRTTARKPVEGTVPRGFKPYPYPNTPEGYELAGANWKMPEYIKTPKSLEEGKKLYGIYCAICHGEKGDGQGTIVQRGVFPPPPDYKVRLPQITEGNMYHSIYYGRNLMGSHASQLDPDERWKVIYYIQKLAGVGPFAQQ